MRQAPYSCLRERTNLPSTPSPTLPPERSEPPCSSSRARSPKTRRIRTARHTRSRSSPCTHHPGCPDSPKGADALDVSETVYQHFLPSGRAVDAGLYRRPSLEPQLTVRTTAVRAPTVKSSQRFFWLLIGAALTQVLPPLRDASPQNQRPRATRQPKPRTRTRPNSHLVPYRLDTPTPPTVARR